MNTNTTIGIVIAIIVLGVGAYFFFGHSSAPSESALSSANQSATPSSLKALIAAGTSQTCTFSDDQSATSGTVHIASGKVRGDFTSTANGQTTQMHMISDGTTAYTWIDGMSSGFKSSMTAATSSRSSQTFDSDKQMNYTCSPSGADASLFILPAGVTFKDVSAMMPSSAGAKAGAGAASACSQCDSVPAAYQAQCRVSAGCK